MTPWDTFVLAVSEEQLGVLVCLAVLLLGSTLSAARHKIPLKEIIFSDLCITLSLSISDRELKKPSTV